MISQKREGEREILMDIKKVRIMRGVAQRDIEIHGKQSSYTGAWNLVVEGTDGAYYGLECLVPGKPDTLTGLADIFGDLSKKEYLLDMKKVTNKDGLEPVSEEEAKELREVLQNVKEGKLTPINVYGQKIGKDYADRIINFLDPRVEIAAKHFIEGSSVATFKEIERELQPPTEIPPIPHA